MHFSACYDFYDKMFVEMIDALETPLKFKMEVYPKMTRRKRKMTKQEMLKMLNDKSLDNMSKIRYLKKKAEEEEERIKDAQEKLIEIRYELMQHQNKQIEINGHIRHADVKIKYSEGIE